TPDTVTVKDGNWFDPSVWSNGVPTSEMNAQIDHSIVIKGGGSGDFNSDGKTNAADYVLWRDQIGTLPELKIWAEDFLGFNNAEVDNLNLYGTLSFDTESISSLTVTTLTVISHHDEPGGRLEVGTSDNPITGSVDIIFRDKPI